MHNKTKEPAIVWLHCECKNRGACTTCLNRGYYFNHHWLQWFNEYKSSQANDATIQIHHHMRTEQQIKNRQASNKRFMYKQTQGEEYHEAY